MQKLKWAEAKTLIDAQGVSSHRHHAFICPICGTVQSMASLVKAGASKETVDKYIGFSCEGRFSGVGPVARERDKSKKAAERRLQRGCDWTLGGLFKLHKLEVEDENRLHPHFEIASADQAQKLEAAMAEQPTRENSTD